MAKSDPKTDVETTFPSIARWVGGCGWIEMGDQDWQGFVARALDGGGIVCEKAGCQTLAESMAALENGLKQWFKENGR